jgi:hypothetical protein
VPAASAWRWSSALPARVQESARWAVPSSHEDGGASDAHRQGYTDSCGRFGWAESGSSSNFPRCKSSASIDSWSEEPGVCPRPMLLHCCFHPGLDVRYLLRLASKHFCDGAPPDLGYWRLLRHRRPAVQRRRSTEISADLGIHRVHGPQCNFFFCQGPLCKMVQTAVMYPPPMYLYSYAYFVLFP